MKRILPILIIISFLSCSEKNVPLGLRGTVNRIDKELNDTIKYDFKIAPEVVASSKHHFGLGLNVRNEYNLWKGGLLKMYFKLNGIKHPDDMSGIILTTYHRKLNNEPINFKEQKKYYKTYWKLAETGQDTLEGWWNHMHPDTLYNQAEKEYYSNFQLGSKILGSINAWKKTDYGGAGSAVDFIAEVVELRERELLLKILDIGAPKEGFELHYHKGDTLTSNPYEIYLIPPRQQ